MSDPAAVPFGLKEKVYLKMVEKGSATAGLQALEDEPAPSPAVLENEFWGGIADDLPPPPNLPPPSRVRPLPLENGDDDFDGGMADARAGGSGGNQGRLAGDDNERGEVIGAVTHVEGMPVYEEAATNGAEGATRYKVLCPLAKSGQAVCHGEGCAKRRNRGANQTSLGPKEPLAYLACWARAARGFPDAKKHVAWAPSRREVAEYYNEHYKDGDLE